MPNSTTLESLNIEINGSAKNASEGIGSLIGSLRSMARGIGTVLPALRSLNSELRTLSSYGRIRLPSLTAPGSAASSAIVRTIENRTREFKATASVLKEFQNVNTATWQSWRYGPRPLPSMTNNLGAGTMIPAEQSFLNRPYTAGAVVAQQQATLANGGTATWAQDQQKAAQAYNAISDGAKKAETNVKGATNAMKESATATRQVGNEMEKAERKAGGFSKAFGQIGRIARTMLIRTALRSLMKAFSESWSSAYEFSSAMGGSFANAVDASRTIISDTATTIVQTFAPVLEALVPVFYVVSNAVQYLCQGLQWLFSLFGMTSDLMGKSVTDINKYSGAAGKANQTQKNLLASWDELNVIQSSGGGGGGGGAGSKYKPGSLKDIVSAETNAILSLVTGEAMLAIGLILAVTGHIPAGIGMMAIGAASVAKTMLVDFEKLPREIQATLTRITTIVGAASLALGVILAFTGHIPLGVGLMALGAANLGLSVMVGSGIGIDEQIKAQITKIMAIAGASMMAIGLILTFFNPALGLGLLAAGIGTWYGANAFDHDGLVKLVDETLGSISGFFSEKWGEITETVSGAWDSVMKWGDENLLQPIRDAWQGISDFFATLFGDSNTDGSIAKWASDAWTSVSTWWSDNMQSPIENAWESVISFFQYDVFGTTETGIMGFFCELWDTIQQLWGDITAPIRAAWDAVVSFFNEIIGTSETGIIGDFSALWAEICQLWGDIIGNVTSAWSTVATWFHNNVTVPIGNFFIDCINGIIDGINWVIRQMNKISIRIPAVNGLWDEIKIGVNIAELGKLSKMQAIEQKANGAYDIPKGDLFIANEAGAELVGSLNGKTTVANENQIISGIQRGVTDANAAQNELLREQNNLLRRILQKTGNVEINPSAGWGKFNANSADMYSMTTGR